MTVASASPDTAAPVGPPHRTPAHARRRTAAGGAPWYFLLPAAAFFGFVTLWPSLQGAAFAFTDWDGLSQVREFVGFDQFTRLLEDPAATGAVWHTLLIAIAIVVVQNVIGLLLALGVHTIIKSRHLLRVLFFAPAIITPVATAYLWQYLMSPPGAINELFETLGLGFLAQDWLGDQDLALWSIVAVVVWQYAGYSMVIFLANLQGVPEELLEAARVDGAGRFARFWHIVRPQLAPAITINLSLSMIGGLKLFDQVYVMTGGGPGSATETMSTLIYKNAFQFNAFGYGIAIALVLTVFVAVMSGFQYWALGRQQGSSS
jgi:raffinose/stachyose/melibiose transport system permease protein